MPACREDEASAGASRPKQSSSIFHHNLVVARPGECCCPGSCCNQCRNERPQHAGVARPRPLAAAAQGLQPALTPTRQCVLNLCASSLVKRADTYRICQAKPGASRIRIASSAEMPKHHVSCNIWKVDVACQHRALFIVILPVWYSQFVFRHVSPMKASAFRCCNVDHRGRDAVICRGTSGRE